MILFFTANGDLIKSVPTPVYQGSNKASRIWFVCPTGVNNVVTVAFKLPNGEYTPENLLRRQRQEVGDMANATEGTGLAEVLDQNGNAYYIWYYDVPKPITAWTGEVTAQFFITNSATGSVEVVATASYIFNVLPGVAPANAPAPENDYDAIIEALLQIYSIVSELKDYKDNLQEQFGTLQANLETDIEDYKENTTLALNNKFDELEENTSAQINKNTNNISAIFNVLDTKNLIQVAEDVKNVKVVSQSGAESYYDEFNEVVEGETLNIVDGAYTTLTKIEGDTKLIDVVWDGRRSKVLKPSTISGIKSTGRNLFPTWEELKPYFINNDGLTTTITDKGLFINGTFSEDETVQIYNTGGYRIPFELPAGTYTLSSGATWGGSANNVFSGTVYIDFERADKSSIKEVTSFKAPKTFTLTEDCKLIFLEIRFNKAVNGQTIENLYFKPMLTIGSNIYEYEPSGKECILTFPEPLELNKYDNWENGKLYSSGKSEPVKNVAEETAWQEGGAPFGYWFINEKISASDIVNDIDFPIISGIDGISFSYDGDTLTAHIDTSVYPDGLTLDEFKEVISDKEIYCKTKDVSVFEKNLENEYPVYNGGTTQMQGATEGVNVTLTNDYLIYVGE